MKATFARCALGARCMRTVESNSSDDPLVPATYRFQLTVTVDDDHAAIDDPEWFADAAWGALTNLYGVEAVYSNIEILGGGARN